MLVIHDEQLTQKLKQIAEREKRPIEDVLKSMVAQYPPEAESAAPTRGQIEAVKRVRRRLYAEARQYWQSVGDSAKAAMTDEQLDEEFGAFDEEGIPRLKSELSPEPPPGSLAYAAMISERGEFRSGTPDLAQRSREILDEYFADEIASRIRGEDAGERNSG